MAYAEYFAILERAMESDAGIRVFFKEKGDALSFRTRLHKARFWDRRNNSRVYALGDPLYNKSEFDSLVVREPFLDENRLRWVVRIAKVDLSKLEIEDGLGEDDEEA